MKLYVVALLRVRDSDIYVTPVYSEFKDRLKEIEGEWRSEFGDTGSVTDVYSYDYNHPTYVKLYPTDPHSPWMYVIISVRNI